MAGWISLDRQIQEHWIWQDRFSKGQAWIDLLLLANHEDSKQLYKGELVTCKRGDVNRSIKWLSERWGWSRKAVKHFLDLLERDGMVATEVTTNRTTITLVNWEKYQGTKPKRNTKGSNEGNNIGSNGGNNEGSNKGSTYNNVNNDNNENNIVNNNINNKYPSSFNEFWECYPRKQDKGQAYKQYQARLNDGYSEEQLLIACKKYAAECENENREKRYIKHGATFLSINEPFVDYLKEGVNNEQPKGRVERNTQSREEYEAEMRELAKGLYGDDEE